MKSKSFAGKIIVFLIIVLSLSGCGEKKEELEKHSNPVFIAEGIRRVSMMENGKAVLDIAYEPKEYESSYEYWKIHVPYGEEAVVDTETMLEFYRKLEKLDKKVASEYPDGMAEELKKTKSKITLEYCRADKEESNSYEENADSIATLLISGGTKDGFYYAAYEEDLGTIYQVAESDIDEILKTNIFNLILKISAVVPMDTVTQVIMDVDGETYKWNPEKEKDSTLYQELQGILIKEEIKTKKQNEGETLLKIQFVRNKKEIPDMLLEYRSYDGVYASVSVNGKENFLVDKKEVGLLKEKIKLYSKK